VRFNGSLLTLSAAGTVNLTIAPGVYVLNVTAAGYYAQQQNVTVGAGMTQSIPIVLLEVPLPPPASGPSGLPLFSGELALGVALLVVAAVGVAIYVTRRRRRARPDGTPDEAIWEPDAADGADEEPPVPAEGSAPPKSPS
jgi:hypothetical protein